MRSMRCCVVLVGALCLALLTALPLTAPQAGPRVGSPPAVDPTVVMLHSSVPVAVLPQVATVPQAASDEVMRSFNPSPDTSALWQSAVWQHWEQIGRVPTQLVRFDNRATFGATRDVFVCRQRFRERPVLSA